MLSTSIHGIRSQQTGPTIPCTIELSFCHQLEDQNFGWCYWNFHWSLDKRQLKDYSLKVALYLYECSTHCTYRIVPTVVRDCVNYHYWQTSRGEWAPPTCRKGEPVSSISKTMRTRGTEKRPQASLRLDNWLYPLHSSHSPSLLILQRWKAFWLWRNFTIQTPYPPCNITGHSR